MPRVTASDGRVLEWTGHNISYCTKCEELFNSGAAFDHHLKRDGKQGVARHDISGMPRNAKGRLVTSLREPEGADEITEGASRDA